MYTHQMERENIHLESPSNLPTVLKLSIRGGWLYVIQVSCLSLFCISQQFESMHKLANSWPSLGLIAK